MFGGIRLKAYGEPADHQHGKEDGRSAAKQDERAEARDQQPHEHGDPDLVTFRIDEIQRRARAEQRFATSEDPAKESATGH
jgi:hypothetical protein